MISFVEKFVESINLQNHTTFSLWAHTPEVPRSDFFPLRTTVFLPQSNGSVVCN